MFENIQAFAAFSEKSELEPFKISRRNLGKDDVLIDILYCGVCHTDIHYIDNDWGISNYPLVPGHEIVGKITDKGENVKTFSLHDEVGVGVLINSCSSCNPCKKNLEPYCENGATFTYNAPDKILGGRTFGGYSKKIVVNKKFVFKIPKNLDLKTAAPLLCAGITAYSPLKNWNIKKGKKVGVIGLGGIGHMAVKFAKALGAEVIVITSSNHKKNDAFELGADGVIVNSNNSLKKYLNTFNFILNTIPKSHDLNPFVELLKLDGTMVIVGAIEPFKINLNMRNLIFGRKSISGSLIGGIKETQEMLNFCENEKISCKTELISIDDLNKALYRMKKSDVKYRFVIDMKTMK